MFVLLRGVPGAEEEMLVVGDEAASRAESRWYWSSAICVRTRSLLRNGCHVVVTFRDRLMQVSSAF